MHRHTDRMAHVRWHDKCTQYGWGSKRAARSALKLRTNECPKIRTLGTDRAIIKVKSSPWKTSAYLSTSLRQVCLIHSESRVCVVNMGYRWPLATWMLLLYNKENSSAFSQSRYNNIKKEVIGSIKILFASKYFMFCYITCYVYVLLYNMLCLCYII